MSLELLWPLPLLSQGGLPEVVARGNAAFLRHSVQPGEGIFGDTLVPGLVQVTHPADLNAQNTTLRKGPGLSSPLRCQSGLRVCGE